MAHNGARHKLSQRHSAPAPPQVLTQVFAYESKTSPEHYHPLAFKPEGGSVLGRFLAHMRTGTATWKPGTAPALMASRQAVQPAIHAFRAKNLPLSNHPLVLKPEGSWTRGGFWLTGVPGCPRRGRRRHREQANSPRSQRPHRSSTSRRKTSDTKKARGNNRPHRGRKRRAGGGFGPARRRTE